MITRVGSETAQLTSGKFSLDAGLWSGSYNGRESSLHQLAPFVGKLKSGMVRVLIDRFSETGDVVLDPFCGSGVVPLEAALLGRIAIANDLSPYAYVVTKGKLSACAKKEEAIDRALDALAEIEARAEYVDTQYVPDWVKEFFHPKTLSEILAAFEVLWERSDYFTIACLLGILHHVRPGFLSYPASHLTPYLRHKKYPPESHSEMYEYRDLRSRLLAKIERAYRRTFLPANWDPDAHQVFQVNSMCLPLEDGTIDTIVSSPPYFGALDYARDNRLRLWFLGIPDWKELESRLTANDRMYVPQMTKCVAEMYRVLKPGNYCLLVLGDVHRNGRKRAPASIISQLAEEVSQGKFVTQAVYEDLIPDERRSRRRTRTTTFERILVLQKLA